MAHNSTGCRRMVPASACFLGRPQEQSWWKAKGKQACLHVAEQEEASEERGATELQTTRSRENSHLPHDQITGHQALPPTLGITIKHEIWVGHTAKPYHFTLTPPKSHACPYHISK